MLVMVVNIGKPTLDYVLLLFTNAMLVMLQPRRLCGDEIEGLQLNY